MISRIPSYAATPAAKPTTPQPPAPETAGPPSPWPQHPDAKAPEGGGMNLGLAGKILGVIMDLPRPTARKMLSPEQVQEIKQALQPGDVILEANDEYPGWEVNAKLLLKSDWVHAALYVGNDTIIDATTERNGVATVSVDDFSKCHHLAVLRPAYKTDADKQAALKYAHDSIGIPYDFDWRLDNKALYCTEFVANALKAGPNPIEIPTTHALGQDIISPQTFLQRPELTTVWTTGSNYWGNLLARSRPFAVQAGIGTAVGFGASALGAGPVVATALGVAVGGALFAGSMWRIAHRPA
jgi:uncharacterized protein YycO